MYISYDINEIIIKKMKKFFLFLFIALTHKTSEINSIECFNCNFCNDLFSKNFVPRILCNTSSSSCYVIKFKKLCVNFFLKFPILFFKEKNRKIEKWF
jgi:hypothetical protein